MRHPSPLRLPTGLALLRDLWGSPRSRADILAALKAAGYSDAWTTIKAIAQENNIPRHPDRRALGYQEYCQRRRETKKATPAPTRTCLRCPSKFTPAQPGYRLCPNCRRFAAAAIVAL